MSKKRCTKCDKLFEDKEDTSWPHKNKGICINCTIIESNGKTLVQIHHQFPKEDGRTEMVAQNEIETLEDMKVWEEGVKREHPLPKDACWFHYTEGAKQFVMAAQGIQGKF